MPKTRNLRGWLLPVILIWFAISNCYLLWQSRAAMARGTFDFANFYSAGVLVQRGQSADLYNKAAQWKVQQEFSAEVKERQAPMRYLRPPYEALFFSLFAIWSFPKALLIWTSLKLLVLFMLPYIVVRKRPWNESFPLWMVGLLALGTYPVSIDLALGQDAVLLALLYAMVFWLLDSGKDEWAGVALAASLFKFQFALPFAVIFLIAGRTRLLRGFIPMGAITMLISGWMVGWRELLHYPSYLLTLNRASGVGVFPEIQITFRGLLTLFVGRSPDPGPIQWVLAPLSLAAIGCTGWICRKAGNEFLAECFALAGVVAIVTSYYACSYDLVLLMVPLLAMRTRPPHRAAAPDRVTKYLEWGGVYVLLFAPAFWFAELVLKAECLLALPLLAVGIALARRLLRADATMMLPGSTMQAAG